MGFVEDLDNKIDDYLSGKYEIVELDYIPVVENVAIGKKAYKTKMCAFFIDMRNSSKLMIEGWKETSAKVHKAFATTVAEVVNDYGGKLRDFQGDGILAFWRADTVGGIRDAVKAAMVTKWFLRVKFNDYFSRYLDNGIDFGIGLHWQDGLVVRAGITSKTQNNDLIYISPSVNIAAKIADRMSGPAHIGVTGNIHKYLDDSLLYSTKTDTWGNEQKVEMWKQDYYSGLKWGNNNLDLYTTNYWWSRN